MTRLIHVLGSEIPHHNHTVLNFFNHHLAADSEQAREFMVVCRTPETLPETAALKINCWPDKKTLAQAVVACAKADRQQRFLFHGQFNAALWLALLNGGLQRQQVSWHIWGADLYENATRLKFRLFYHLRRLAQGRVGHVFGTQGDLVMFKQRHPKLPTQLLYFPTRMAPVAAESYPVRHIDHAAPLTVLVGNSGDRSNEHIRALHQVARHFGQQVQVIVPMGYPDNNDGYIKEVTRAARDLFPVHNCKILRQRLAFEEYQQLIAHCDVGYFLFARQQGIGTLCLLIQAGVPCVLSRQNPFWQDMVAQRLPVLFDDDALDVSLVREAQRQLSLVPLNRVAFFNPNYTAGWQNALSIASGVAQ